MIFFSDVNSLIPSINVTVRPIGPGPIKNVPTKVFF